MGLRGPKRKITTPKTDNNNDFRAKMPSWMSKKAADLEPDEGIIVAQAKKEWKRLVPILQSRNLLTESDLSALEKLCHAHGQYEMCIQRINEQGATIKQTNTKGHTYTAQNPYIHIQKMAWQQYSTLCNRFGITPGDRQEEIKQQEGLSDYDKLRMWGNFLQSEFFARKLTKDMYGRHEMFSSKEDFFHFCEVVKWPKF